MEIPACHSCYRKELREDDFQDKTFTSLVMQTAPDAAVISVAQAPAVDRFLIATSLQAAGKSNHCNVRTADRR